MTLTNKAAAFVKAYAPDHPELREVFIAKLLVLMEHYGSDALKRGSVSKYYITQLLLLAEKTK